VTLYSDGLKLERKAKRKRSRRAIIAPAKSAGFARQLRVPQADKIPGLAQFGGRDPSTAVELRFAQLNPRSG